MQKVIPLEGKHMTRPTIIDSRPTPVYKTPQETPQQYETRMAMIAKQSLLFMLRIAKNKRDAMNMAEHMPYPDPQQRGVYVDMREKLVVLGEYLELVE